MSSSNPTLSGGPNDLTVHIFVSYAREDKRWLDPEYRFNLIHFLKESLRRDNVDVWYDKELMGGDEFRRLIASKIDGAQIALLLVSQHFLNSEFIETFELPRIAARAERKEMVVIPVLVERCAWKDFPFLADRQMVPSSSPLIHYTESEVKWADVRFEILDGLRQQVKRVRQGMQAEAPRKETDEERKAREEKERREREEAERKAREEAERKEREEKERKEREEADRKARELAEQKAREEAERKTREIAERKAREEAERKKREEQQRKGREEKKDSLKVSAVLFAVLKRIFALVPLACLILAADLVFHLWLGHAGAQWDPLDSGITVAVRAITGSPDAKTLYACGTGTSFLISTDGGGTWANHKTNEASNCQSIALTPDGKKILIPAISITGTVEEALGVTSAILSADGGGAGWQTIQLEDTPQSQSAQSGTDEKTLLDNVANNASGYYTFSNLQKVGSLFSTVKANDLRSQMRGIFSDGTRIMAVGENGEIFGTKYQSTGTWGSDIEVQDRVVRTSLNAVSGPQDGRFLIAVGDHGAILGTADWGKTWKSEPSGVILDLNAVFTTADGQLLCAVGNRGTILTSTDWGDSWTQRHPGVLSNLLGVFGTADGKHLWAVGVGGMILESNDSGATWKQRPSGVKVNLYAVFGTSDGKRLWVVGDDGKIIESKRSLFF